MSALVNILGVAIVAIVVGAGALGFMLHFDEREYLNDHVAPSTSSLAASRARRPP